MMVGRHATSTTKVNPARLAEIVIADIALARAATHGQSGHLLLLLLCGKLVIEVLNVL